MKTTIALAFISLALCYASTAYAVFLPGDFNEDGVVDGLDLAIWEDNYGLTDIGDADDDDDTDGSDFLVWQHHLGEVAILLNRRLSASD